MKNQIFVSVTVHAVGTGSTQEKKNVSNYKNHRLHKKSNSIAFIFLNLSFMFK